MKVVAIIMKTIEIPPVRINYKADKTKLAADNVV